MKIASIFKKVLMAVTGLLLVGFLVSHLAGNMFIYAGATSFNAYAEFLESKPAVVYTAETALLLIFLTHVYCATRLTLENKAARPNAYSEHENAGGSTLASRTMFISGIIIFIFLIIHVGQFKFGEKNGNLFGLVIGTFQRPAFLAVYVVAMLLLGLHIGHGIGSAFQSLGLFSGKRQKVRLAGCILGWILALGFASIPVYAFLALPAVSVSENLKK